MIRPHWNPVSFLVEQHLHLESIFQDETSHESAISKRDFLGPSM